MAIKKKNKKKENVLLCLSQVNVAVLEDGEEEELPDEMENLCSGNNDGNSPFDHSPFSLPLD